jgi:hypothetical protein
MSKSPKHIRHKDVLSFIDEGVDAVSAPQDLYNGVTDSFDEVYNATDEVAAQRDAIASNIN